MRRGGVHPHSVWRGGVGVGVGVGGGKVEDTRPMRVRGRGERYSEGHCGPRASGSLLGHGGAVGEGGEDFVRQVAALKIGMSAWRHRQPHTATEPPRPRTRVPRSFDAEGH